MFSSMLVFCGVLHAQNSPSVTLVGSSPSLTKGSINTEILASIIQKKQAELRQFVFRNMVIRNFNSYNHKTHLKNFATYQYIYNVMETITGGKNKSVITKSIIESTAEFAYLHGVVLYIQHAYKLEGDSMEAGGYTVGGGVVKAAMAKTTVVNERYQFEDNPEVKNYNYLIDLCYKILKEDPSLAPNFEFSSFKQSDEMGLWYNHDNIYELACQQEAKEREKHQAIYKNVTTKIKALRNLIANVNGTLTKFEDLGSTADFWQSGLMSIQGLVELDAPQQQAIAEINQADFAEVLPVVQLLAQFKKTQLKGLSLNEDQFYALKAIAMNFLDLSKNQFKNNVVAGVLGYLMENTILEYLNDQYQQQVSAQEATAESRAYLYIDAEAAIVAIHEHFAPSARKGKYVQLFFSIGTNQASFINTNTLSADDAGNPASLDNFYYASEKIGVKIKLWNWRYTHSFAPGERFSFYCLDEVAWRRPQKRPFINDIHVIGYASGILYNLANLKSTDHFNHAIAGAGLGVTFFNGLALNASLARPFTERSFKKQNTFFNLGIDIPIIEYISALATNK